ncbi:hypothetical protein D6850_03245 [Roseovarius spongiae]|uniref:Hedgehog/Intein (Hint) domain-containing protein n=1 Tax=Roseovarius spongiae TaxID=2320272 RepID=A0A3A8AZU0_9RHOB|nr:Hint domain-containing protein [Roseovarius spongiae]RKF16580.1 hypothetical protein D6850_03245 [Roseovarius spongiae]
MFYNERKEYGPAPLRMAEMRGLITGTCVASRAGWCPIEDVQVGMDILTFDAGFQQVREVNRTPLWGEDGPCPPMMRPYEVPAGVLGNRDVLYLMPDQSVLIELDAAEKLFGDPFALIPVRALDGVRGCTRVVPPQRARVTVLRFDSEQIVFANSGAMFLCPCKTDLLDRALSDEEAGEVYKILPLEAALHLTAFLGAPGPVLPCAGWPDLPEDLPAGAGVAIA